MTTYTEVIGEKLNGILEKTYDAEKGFKKAADNIDNNALKNYFRSKAQERNIFGDELKKEIKIFNQEIYKEGSVAGSVHRAWMDVKVIFSLDDEESMLEEAIKGEKTAINEYEDVINETKLPPSTKSLLVAQKNKIKNGLYSIKSLDDIG
jgi:uncharacterized protein (TIGR02284 family)